MESVQLPTSRAVHYINNNGSTLVMRSVCDCALILTYVACIRSYPVNNKLGMYRFAGTALESSDKIGSSDTSFDPWSANHSFSHLPA